MEPAARCCALGGPCSVTSPGQTARLRSATLSPRCPSSLPANGRCHPVAPFPCLRCPCLLRQPCPRPLDTRFHVPPPEDQVQQPLPIHLAPRGMKHPLRAMPDPVAVEGDFRAHGSASSRVARARASASSSAIRSNIDVPPAGVRRRSSHCSSLLAKVSSSHRGSPGACMACATRVTRRCSLSCVFIAPSVFSTKRRPRPPVSGLPYPRLSACKPPRESRRLHLSSLWEEGARGIHRQDIPRNSGKEPVRHRCSGAKRSTNRGGRRSGRARPKSAAWLHGRSGIPSPPPYRAGEGGHVHEQADYRSPEHALHGSRAAGTGGDGRRDRDSPCWSARSRVSV